MFLAFRNGNTGFLPHCKSTCFVLFNEPVELFMGCLFFICPSQSNQDFFSTRAHPVFRVDLSMSIMSTNLLDRRGGHGTFRMVHRFRNRVITEKRGAIQIKTSYRFLTKVYSYANPNVCSSGPACESSILFRGFCSVLHLDIMASLSWKKHR